MCVGRKVASLAAASSVSLEHMLEREGLRREQVAAEKSSVLDRSDSINYVNGYTASPICAWEIL